MKKTKPLTIREYYGDKLKIPKSRLEQLQDLINYEAEVLVELPKPEPIPDYSYFKSLPSYRPREKHTHLIKMFLP